VVAGLNLHESASLWHPACLIRGKPALNGSSRPAGRHAMAHRNPRWPCSSTDATHAGHCPRAPMSPIIVANNQDAIAVAI